MQWTGLNELREKYLSFFESKGHLRLDSFPLVPKNDPSLLLINSGMAPMKKWFLAQEEPPRHRVTTCQKCIRTPDIERVGITARHGTFFEMLGNFSFQDYFKEEVIPWAWEFLTSDEWMAIPKDKLHISVYEEDDEAYDIWTKKVGIAPDHMVRLGKEDNFWEHGSGPCGPCSEIYFDRGPEYGCGKPTCGVGCDCDRYMEIWNLVFSQFDADGKGHYERLARPNIDTGMGLERLACVMQGVGNLFEVDTVQSVLHHVEHIANKTYGENAKDDISIRVITDHIRSCTFMVSDGILPSNEGRGYVLRRLLRRAARHGRMLGVTRPFLVELVETVIQSSESAYPELREHDAYIKKVIGTEEANFARTIDAGMNILNTMIDGLEKAHEHLLKGLDVFKLNDTFGFPLDLTKEIAAEQGIEIDEEGFHAEMTKQKERARAERLKKNISGWSEDLFGALDAEEEWADEARRYYIGIVGKYGPQVQAVLKKAAGLDIQTICSLHGPVLKENLGFYLEKYDKWSSYQPEESGVVIAYASVYGNTRNAAEYLADVLQEKGQKTVLYDLARCDKAKAVADAFRYDRLVLAGITYNGDLFPCMRSFIEGLTERNYQNRKVAIIENGTWAPMTGKLILGMFEKSKNLTFTETKVSIKSAMNAQNKEEIGKLAEELS
mgnify:CR=1 FL=1